MNPDGTSATIGFMQKHAKTICRSPNPLQLLSSVAWEFKQEFHYVQTMNKKTYSKYSILKPIPLCLSRYLQLLSIRKRYAMTRPPDVAVHVRGWDDSPVVAS